MEKVVVTGGFDNLKSSDIRFLEEASQLGNLHVFVWADAVAMLLDGKCPMFSVEERVYLLQGIRYVHQVRVVQRLFNQDTLPFINDFEFETTTWVVREAEDNSRKRLFCASKRMKYHVVKEAMLKSFPISPEIAPEENNGVKRVVVTGCYDWFHSGHLRFFEEASQLGNLYVVVGSDRNVLLLKGAGHPLFSQEERRYMVYAARFVKQALISSGSGWMDAEPEIASIQPDLYVVNEDGDQPEKRGFCEEHGIQYVVLKRKPREGLPKRESTVLRGY